MEDGSRQREQGTDIGIRGAERLSQRAAILGLLAFCDTADKIAVSKMDVVSILYPQIVN